MGLLWIYRNLTSKLASSTDKELCVSLHQAKEIVGLLGVQKAMSLKLSDEEKYKKFLVKNICRIEQILKEAQLKEV